MRGDEIVLFTRVQTDTHSEGAPKSVSYTTLAITVSSEDVWRSMRASDTVLMDTEREKRDVEDFTTTVNNSRKTEEVHRDRLNFQVLSNNAKIT